MVNRNNIPINIHHMQRRYNISIINILNYDVMGMRIYFAQCCSGKYAVLKINLI